LISNDLAYLPAVRAIDRVGLVESVVITNSSFGAQPLWMRPHSKRTFRVHEIHYSQNTAGFRYIADSMGDQYPAFRHVRVDKHWVWTPGYKTRLESLGHLGRTHVVGPIMMYLPGPALHHSDDEFRIAVFDVTPVYSHKATQIGAISNYYSTENMLSFIDQIVEICEDVERLGHKRARILLKHKRSFTKNFHDHRYLECIDRLAQDNDSFEVVPYDNNIFSMLASCDLSISIPYTSTAYVSSHMHKPAIYFDPTRLLFPTYEPAPFLEFASGRIELLRLIEKSILLKYESGCTKHRLMKSS
jgi:polysaccharide biosynthesis PFTS motif protein